MPLNPVQREINAQVDSAQLKKTSSTVVKAYGDGAALVQRLRQLDVGAQGPYPGCHRAMAGEELADRAECRPLISPQPFTCHPCPCVCRAMLASEGA